MAVIGSINILMQASTEKLTKGLSAAKRKVTSFASEITSAMGPVGGSISGALAGLAIGGTVLAGIEQLRSLANESFNLAGDLRDMADRTGLSVKSLSELQYIAKLSAL